MQTVKVNLEWGGPIFEPGTKKLAKKQLLKGKVLSEFAPNSTAHHMKKHRLSKQFKDEVKDDITHALYTQLPRGFRFTPPVCVEVFRYYSGRSKEFDADAVGATCKPLFDLLGELLFQEKNGRGDSSKFMQIQPVQQIKTTDGKHSLEIVISDVSSAGSNEISLMSAVQLLCE